ncbi:MULTISPECIES: FecR domain-containing protein [unclassified Pseudomonas]|uniref:FecR domain-containing protein n=1 Tax=unclassified Pseudomonas TaxID=196821 RepID=UPI0008773E9B|nr:MULTISPECIES: FecR domain-containing protein [unclassified Pseudomonas]SCZ31156.1 FecR family protein [Pseudomonas sp. NFACC44-2]SDA42038.1 FecR family protein [Pseudomonas sp. NFACC51]SFH53414.1 FecR family protein [Pseudomonas sp. NFACC54]SFT03823.1 FecR family protein [Pseudomonas sp. NFACC48-1]
MNLPPEELRAIRAAAQWYAKLHSGITTDADRAGWNAWLSADPLHGQAWQRMTAVAEQMASVPGALAAPTLSDNHNRSRRQVLRSVLLLTSASGLGWLGWRSQATQNLFCDYRTTVGERREFQLADGSTLLLNTDTSVNVRFDANQRRLELLRGEILVTTAVDPLRRPFKVATGPVEVLALGTRFIVRGQARGGEVAVLEKAVEVSLPAIGSRRRVEAGQRLDFNDRSLGTLRGNDVSVGAWQKGSIIAIDRPLAALLEELSRYRNGVLRCDPAIGDLKVSGVFPVDDTDLALAALESGFSLRVTRYSRFWVQVSSGDRR